MSSEQAVGDKRSAHDAHNTSDGDTVSSECEDGDEVKDACKLGLETSHINGKSLDQTGRGGSVSRWREAGIKIGDLMLGKYSTLGWYKCKVVCEAEGGRWVVEWEDGDEDDILKETRHLKKRVEEQSSSQLRPSIRDSRTPAPERTSRNVAKRMRTSVEDVGGKKRNEEENLCTTSRPKKDLLLLHDKGGKSAIKVVMSDAQRDSEGKGCMPASHASSVCKGQGARAAAGEDRAECSLTCLHTCIARRAELSRKGMLQGKEHELQQTRQELSEKDKEYAQMLQLVRADAAARFAAHSTDLREEHKEREILLSDKDELTSAHTIARQCVQLKGLLQAEKEVRAVLYRVLCVRLWLLACVQGRVLLA